MNLPQSYDPKVLAKIIQDLLDRIKQLEAKLANMGSL